MFRVLCPGFLRERQRAHEKMDDPAADADQLRRSLGFLRRINAVLGYTRGTLHHLQQFSRRWHPGETIRILDIGTGSADIPRAILRWAAECGFDVRVVGIDLHQGTAKNAVGPSDDPRLRIVRADAVHLPFRDGAFDYAICSLFLHHLDSEDVAQVLGGMCRVAGRGMIACDLLRNRRAYAWVKLMTAFSNPMVRHDGPVSVAQAFSPSEVLALREKAGIGFTQYHRHFGHRFALAGEK